MTDGKNKPMADLLPLICEVVDGGGEFTFHPRGTSMEPLISEGRDAIVLSRTHAPGVGDIVLYVRADGTAVVHRIVACDGATYTMCGDNQCDLERGITRGQIKARVSSVIREGEIISLDTPEYRRYVASLARRRMFMRIRRFAARIRNR